MEITLELATYNLAYYEAQLEQSETEMKECPRDSSQWQTALRKRNEAKSMIEWARDAVRGQASKAQRLKERSNLGARFLHRTFANFDKRRDPTAFSSCHAFAERDGLFEDRRNSLLILGGYGSGKTHLAASIANNLVDKSIPALFGTFSEHLEHIREEFDKDGHRQYLASMKTVPMLVIDDLGKEKKTEWSQQILFDVINYRYEHILPFVITTNMNEEELGNYVGGAIYSRMCEACTAVKTSGGDYRKP